MRPIKANFNKNPKIPATIATNGQMILTANNSKQIYKAVFKMFPSINKLTLS